MESVQPGRVIMVALGQVWLPGGNTTTLLLMGAPSRTLTPRHGKLILITTARSSKTHIRQATHQQSKQVPYLDDEDAAGKLCLTSDLV